MTVVEMDNPVLCILFTNSYQQTHMERDLFQHSLNSFANDPT
jgi:hypothetical protein